MFTENMGGFIRIDDNDDDDDRDVHYYYYYYYNYQFLETVKLTKLILFIIPIL